MLSGELSPDLAGAFAGIDFSLSPHVIAAVSGGSDSVALLLLLHRHLATLGLDSRLCAVTIDHQLRPEAAAEANHVAAFCATRGIAHIIKPWTGAKPATGIAAAARDARYRLLLEVARSLGATMILTGHTADDQAETVAMRQARGTGHGLAGMAPAALLNGEIWLLRPLLDQRRALLRDMLRAEAIRWIDDPSNENVASERVRVRRTLTESAVEQLVTQARLAAAKRTELGICAARLIETAATLAAPGLIRLNAGVLRSKGSEPTSAADARVYALRILLAVAGGRQYLPDVTRVEQLLGHLGSEPVRTTLSRTVIDMRRTGIYLYREARRLPPHDCLDDDFWDGRFRVGRRRSAIATDEVPDAPPALVRAAALTQPDESMRTRPIAAPWARLLPLYDFAPAGAVARLIGGDLPPDPPYRGHTAS